MSSSFFKRITMVTARPCCLHLAWHKKRPAGCIWKHVLFIWLAPYRRWSYSCCLYACVAVVMTFWARARVITHAADAVPALITTRKKVWLIRRRPWMAVITCFNFIDQKINFDVLLPRGVQNFFGLYIE